MAKIFFIKINCINCEKLKKRDIKTALTVYNTFTKATAF